MGDLYGKLKLLSGRWTERFAGPGHRTSNGSVYSTTDYRRTGTTRAGVTQYGGNHCTAPGWWPSSPIHATSGINGCYSLCGSNFQKGQVS